MPRRRERESGRRRALTSTRSRDRSQGGVDWTDGLVDLPSAPSTYSVRGAQMAMVIQRIGPHGFVFDVTSADVPEPGAELHVAIPGTPIQAQLITVVGRVAGTKPAVQLGRHVVELALAAHGGVPAAYWDLVTHWAEQG